MTIVDSVGWVAYFRDEALAATYEPHLLRADELLCPSIILCEVTRRLRRDQGPAAADAAAEVMLRTEVVPLDGRLALQAAQVGVEHHLALADAIIYATALTRQASLITSDAHFQGLPLVTYYPRSQAS